MECTVKLPGSETPQPGRFLGLWREENGDVSAVVSLDGHGIMLELVHPSRVNIKEKERETHAQPNL